MRVIFVLLLMCFTWQGIVFGQGEGGVFTSERLAALKTGEGALGNNPQMMNLYNDLRMKFAKMGEEIALGLDDIEGSIYLNENFEVCTLYYEGVAFKKVRMRYDAYNDEMEIREANAMEDVKALVKYAKLSASLNGDTFVYEKYKNSDSEVADGYLITIYPGEVYQLYQRRAIVFKEGKPAKTSLGTSFPNRFIENVSYYMGSNDSLPNQMLLRKAALLKSFGEGHQKEIKDFIQDKRIDINDKKGLINLFAFANSLKPL